MSEEIRDICMAKNSNNGEIIRQELITYKHSKNGVIRHSVERVFFERLDGQDECAESQTTTPILRLSSE